MLHRFRRAMARPGFEQLKGLVKVAETYLAITDRQQRIVFYVGMNWYLSGFGPSSHGLPRVCLRGP